jgi:hypothetical protein
MDEVKVRLQSLNIRDLIFITLDFPKLLYGWRNSKARLFISDIKGGTEAERESNMKKRMLAFFPKTNSYSRCKGRPMIWKIRSLNYFSSKYKEVLYFLHIKMCPRIYMNETKDLRNTRK